MTKLDNVLRSTYRFKRFYAEKVLNVSPSSFSKMLTGQRPFSSKYQKLLAEHLIQHEDVPVEKVKSAFLDFNDSQSKKKQWSVIRPK